MSNVVDSRLFGELAGRRKEDVILPGWCEYSDAEEGYILKAWGERYIIRPEREEIIMEVSSTTPPEYFCVFLVNYLLAKKVAEPIGEWISEKDLAGGSTFFRGPHTIPTHLLTQKYDNDLVSLKKTCDSLSGIPIDFGDCAYSFRVIGSVNVALLYWLGDDDFLPEAKLLVDRSVATLYQLDVVYALLCDTCYRLA